MRQSRIIRGIQHGLRMLEGMRYQHRRNITLRFHPEPVPGETLSTQQNYFFTTDSGLFALREGQLYRLNRHAGYGIAATSTHAYAGVDFGYYSCVVCFPASRLYELADTHVNSEIIYGTMIRDTRGRIHQITAAGDGPLWIANTSRNSLVCVKDAKHHEITPLPGEFGEPRMCDHNHINSVADYGNFQLFTAFTAGNGSMVGIIENDEVTGYAYPYVGIHDIFLTSKGFIMCDMRGRDESYGGIVTEKGFANDMLSPWLGTHVVRGVSGTENESLLGLSVKKELREERKEGSGKVVLIRKGKVADTMKIPSAQIYQIMHASGETFSPVPMHTAAEVHTLFHQTFGAPVHKGKTVMITNG